MGVGGNKGGREASVVDPESHGVGEGGRKTSGLVEIPGGCHKVGRGVESPQSANTPGVANCVNDVR